MTLSLNTQSTHVRVYSISRNELIEVIQQTGAMKIARAARKQRSISCDTMELSVSFREQIQDTRKFARALKRV
jgi:hypothetical protein